MAHSSPTEAATPGMGDLLDHAPHARESFPTSRHRSQAGCRSTGPRPRCESGRVYRGGTGEAPTCGRVVGSFAGESGKTSTQLPNRIAFQGTNNVNNTMIPCPKCRQPGILYSERSIRARIGSKHIAHVLHAWTPENRRMCMLTRSEWERIRKQVPQAEARPQ